MRAWLDGFLFSSSAETQQLEMEAVVLHRVAFLEYFRPKQGQDRVGNTLIPK